MIAYLVAVFAVINGVEVFALINKPKVANVTADDIRAALRSRCPQYAFGNIEFPYMYDARARVVYDGTVYANVELTEVDIEF